MTKLSKHAPIVARARANWTDRRGKPIQTRGTGQDWVRVLLIQDRSGATADFKLKGTDATVTELPLRVIVAKDTIFSATVVRFSERRLPRGM